MATKHISKSAAVRARLDHPIIDSDGHQVEPGPIFLDFLREVGGSLMPDRLARVTYDSTFDPSWAQLSPAERQARRAMRPTWWAIPGRNTRDLATAMFPQLFHSRMEELGLDLSVVYPTYGLLFLMISDDELRQAACRALNRLKAEMFAGLTDRLIPVATIPMYTPAEACAELEYAVGTLGLRAIMMASYVQRPIEAARKISPEAARYSYSLDTFGLDSAHDYDPVWAKCAELGVMPTFHSVGYGWGSRATPSNYVHNHLGNFAASSDAICRGLVLGGVPQRFPQLRFAFMEGGVAWARNLYCDLLSHWAKRNRDAMENYNPALTDAAEFVALAERFGGRFARGRAGEILAESQRRMQAGNDPELHDEWARSGIGGPEQITAIFKRFYFGCEGDDPLNMLAEGGPNDALGTDLATLYGSDLGHWDVPDMSEAAEEAYELVEQGRLSPAAFRAMVFTNAVEFWRTGNPDFFKGTAVEAAAASVATS
jgi:predicted TIM-barrel fold metal-dependent hydrolase